MKSGNCIDSDITCKCVYNLLKCKRMMSKSLVLNVTHRSTCVHVLYLPRAVIVKAPLHGRFFSCTLMQFLLHLSCNS